jgi:glucokinase
MKLIEKVYVDTVPRAIQVILGADIGGTNSNFGIFELTDNKLTLLFSLHAKSQQVDDFTQLCKQVQEFVASQYDMKIQAALFASAGVVSPDRDSSRPTNLSFEINAHAIKRATEIPCVYVVNDFEVIGYGINLIDTDDLVKVHHGTERKWAQKAILGAGTGLGKCIMFWNSSVNRYVPVASEGGHADFAAQHLIEIDLIQYIQRIEGFECNVSWEDVLSGNGIQRIYQFFHARANGGTHAQSEKVPHPDEIFKSRNHDQHSKDTFELYTKLYARCAKNFVLDALALGGIYIAGGIAANNLPMFELPAFAKEFVNCGKQGYLLEDVPVFVVTDYNVSLYGAAYYLVLEGVCKAS